MWLYSGTNDPVRLSTENHGPEMINEIMKILYSAKAVPKGLGNRAFAHGAHGNSYRCFLGSRDHFRDAWVSRLGTDLLKRLTVRP